MDPWQTLGVSKDASPEDIKQAYRKLAMKHHPDRGGNEADFKNIQTAYDDITSGRATQPPPNSGFNGFNHNDPFGWSAHFGEGFGAPPFGFQHRRMRKMEDLSVEYAISLEDLYHGKADKIRIMTPDRGAYIELDVNITPGMPSNARIRYPGAASTHIPGVVPGDVFILIAQKPHAKFRRDGDDLHTEKEVSIFDAMLGKDISLTTLDGRLLQMRIPPGARPGLRMRVAGSGMPKSNGSSNNGDLYVQLNMKVPMLKEEDLDKKLVDIMRENK